MASGDTLDELLGPGCSRPGELHEPAPLAVSSSLNAAARELSISASLALTVVAERSLVTQELAVDAATLVALLDQSAAHTRPPRGMQMSAASASYARMLVAALNGRPGVLPQDDAVLVVPTRLADRLRATPGLDLPPSSLRVALAWELASVCAGRTMTEWALAEVLAAVYPVSAARQLLAASIAAR